MNPSDVEQLAAMMVRYRLAEITLGDCTIKKTVHEMEQFHTERPPAHAGMAPSEEEPLDDEILFHSSFEPRRTVEDLIARAAKEKADA